MTAPIVQIRYDELDQAAARFAQAAERGAELERRLQSAFRPLQEGGWIGRGAAAFESTLQGEIFPACTRLIAALETAREVTLQIRSLLAGAEEEAAGVFQGDAEHWEETPIFTLQQAPPPGPSSQATMSSIALDLIPGVGELKGFAEVVTGRDLVTGEDLGHWRWAGLLGIVGLNELKLLKHSDEAIALARRADDAVDLARREGRLFSELAPGGGLMAHTARGGHLIERHVGKTDAELLARLADQPNIRGASTFTDRAMAESIASRTLRDNQAKIRDWIENSAAPTLKLTFTGDGTTAIGRGVMRGSDEVQTLYNAELILKRDANGGYILTGYPRP